jgi:hypothetical protein
VKDVDNFRNLTSLLEQLSECWCASNFAFSHN